MAETELYSLELLFDGSQINRDQLDKQSAKAIDLQRDSSVKRTTEELTTVAGTRCLKLSIKGTLEEVDSCHQKLVNAQLIRRDFCILLLDEPGNEIRKRAYPTLAQIETRLRTFINLAMTEIIGFDWWESMVPQQVRERVQQVEENAPKESLDRYHPLERTYFADLLLVVTGTIQRWTEEKPLSAADLQGLLAESSSIQEVREKLTEKTRRISLWDEVFTHYFQKEEHKEQWRDLQKTIQEEVILRRHRVMHHRAMHLWELEKLDEIEQEVDALIGSAKSQLTEEERAEVRKTSEEWLDVIQRAQALQMERLNEVIGRLTMAVPSPTEELARTMSAFSRALAEAVPSPTEELARVMREMVRPPSLTKMAKRRRETVTPKESGTNCVASTKGNRFHRPSCQYGRRVPRGDRVSFADREEAIAQGYSPCKVCKP
jgi:hypothetical protein